MGPITSRGCCGQVTARWVTGSLSLQGRVARPILRPLQHLMSKKAFCKL